MREAWGCCKVGPESPLQRRMEELALQLQWLVEGKRMHCHAYQFSFHIVSFTHFSFHGCHSLAHAGLGFAAAPFGLGFLPAAPSSPSASHLLLQQISTSVRACLQLCSQQADCLLAVTNHAGLCQLHSSVPTTTYPTPFTQAYKKL